jgi:uncharacterized membrane protein
MAFCPNCGSQAQGAFCPNCGTSIAAGSGAAGAASMPSPGVPPPPVAASGLEPHIAGALCYTPFAIGLIASIIFILVAPYNQNKFVRFSAFQSLFLHLGMIVAFVALGIVATIITLVLHFLGFLLVILYPVLWLGILVIMLFMMYKAFNNETVKLPFIGDLAQKQA